MAINEFDSRLEGELDLICNMISMLPLEYDTFTKVTKVRDGLAKEMATYKPLYYYVMHNGSVNKEKSIFERPDMSLQQHLKPLYIRAKVEDVGVNKVIIDCGFCINVIPYSLLKRIDKYDIDLKSNNMVLSNYEGKTSRPLSVTQVDVVVGTTT